MKNKLLLGIFALLIGFTSCTEQEKPVANQTQETEKPVTVPSFNGDSAYLFVKNQVEFGPRVPNTPAHRRCGDYLEQKLKELGAVVNVQEFTANAFDGTPLRLKNYIGSINPDASKRILLAAHWDTRPFADQAESDKKKPIDGANDGASGVGVLLELLRTIKDSEVKPEVGIDVIFFDGEDYGQPDFAMEKGRVEDSWCLGSQFWSKNKHKPGYSAYYGILLDMVGARNAKFAKEGTSMHYAPSVVNKVWGIANSKGYGNFFISQIAPPIIDDHAYVNDLAGIPMIDIIEFNPAGNNYFGDYWHTHEDNMNIIDPVTMQAVGQTLLEVLYRE